MLWLLLAIENLLRAHSHHWYWDERCNKLHAGHSKTSGCSQLFRVIVEKLADFLYRAVLQNLALQPERGWCGVSLHRRMAIQQTVFIATNNSESSNKCLHVRSLTPTTISPQPNFPTPITVPWSRSSSQAGVPAHNGSICSFFSLQPIVAIPSGRTRRCGHGIRWRTRLWRIQARQLLRSSSDLRPLCLLCVGQDVRMRDVRLAGEMVQQCPLPLLECSGPKSLLLVSISTPRIASLNCHDGTTSGAENQDEIEMTLGP